MKVRNQISPAIISATVSMLSPYVKDITPTSLIAALQSYEVNGSKKIDNRPQRPYTVKEACDLLGITKPTIYRMFDAGALTKLKVGNSTRIAADEINDLLNPN